MLLGINHIVGFFASEDLIEGMRLEVLLGFRQMQVNPKLSLILRRWLSIGGHKKDREISQSVRRGGGTPAHP